MRIFWNAQISEMAESYTFSVKSHTDLDAAMRNWQRLLFVQL